MKTSSRFSILAFGTALLSALAVVVTLLHAEYQTRKSLWGYEIEMLLALNTSWPLMLHFQTTEKAREELSIIANRTPNTLFLAAYTTSGGEIARTPSDAPQTQPIARDRTAILNKISGHVSTKMPLAEGQAGWTSVMPGNGEVFVISIPVLSPVNTQEFEISYQEYRSRLVADSGPSARFVAGYIEAGFDESRLLASMVPSALRIIGIASILLTFVLLLIRSLTRSISQPLTQIAAVAHAISAEETPKKIRLSATRNDEISEIAQVLNDVIDGVHRMRNRLNVDRTLLSMKVDNTSQKLDAAKKEIHQTRSQMKRVAHYDSVTGLPNRQLMLEQLALLMQIAAREKKHLGCLFIEIQNLRKINETFGRAAGDRILREIGGRIQDSVRQSDLVSRGEQPRDIARVGNDEFCVLLHGINGRDDALNASRRILDQIQKPIQVESTLVAIQLRMGVALAPDDGKTPEQLSRAADVALNHARSNKTNKPVLYSRAIDVQGSERFQLEAALREANYNAEFQLVYQPQIDTLSGKVLGAEALIRWHHPKLGAVPPFKFIPITEETGQIIELGEWIVDTACRDFATLQATEPKLAKISVNVSAAQLTDEFIEHVSSCMAQHGLQRNQLELELTEGMLVQNVDAVMERLYTLKNDVGVRLSVDDFGTGYSSLAYLSRFPLDELKVDRSFVLAMEDDEAAEKVTGAIIAIGRELSLDVVVEGVETPQQLEKLRELGGTTIQGYLFSRPLELAELTTFLSTFKITTGP
ncbi:MAG: hypothetical protein RLZZ602_116 [Pseudomonadota bacterium]